MQPARRAHRMYQPRAAHAQTTAGFRNMSARLLQVCDLLSIGFTNKEIAATLGLSPATIKIYVRNVFEILGTSNRVKAARWYWEHFSNASACSPLTTPATSRQPLSGSYE